MEFRMAARVGFRENGARPLHNDPVGTNEHGAKRPVAAVDSGPTNSKAGCTCGSRPNPSKSDADIPAVHSRSAVATAGYVAVP
jgi:hypothetical protein